LGWQIQVKLMALLDHWHPVLLSRDLGRAPASVRLAGTELALFRTPDGQIGALEDYCPHRRMKLSCGTVAGDRLRCRYHGWTFDRQGHGESPGTPKLQACARSFDAVERHGAIWVKSTEANPEFPHFHVDGYFNICNLSHRARAPLELVLDNFCEIEHTPTTHDFFGYPLERMQEVEVEFLPTDTTVRVVNRGPRKPFARVFSWILGVGRDWQFMDDWTTYFSPVYSVYDHWWQHPVTGKPSRVRWRLYIFFVPIDDTETAVFTFAYTKSSYPGPAGGARLLAWLMKRKLDYEIRLDVNILEGLADKDTRLEGMKLSRFDKALGLNRERIAKVYRGQNGA
jgi:phenylpropionate dioxygenase-like ring-hydroxylating dioxygenase large terminal subunit